MKCSECNVSYCTRSCAVTHFPTHTCIVAFDMANAATLDPYEGDIEMMAENAASTN